MKRFRKEWWLVIAVIPIIALLPVGLLLHIGYGQGGEVVYGFPGPKTGQLQRVKIHGGWIVTNRPNQGVCFVPDSGHEWVLDD